MSDPESTDQRPPLAGVMGWPVAHSKSPLIFAHWFAEAGIAGSYQRLAVRPEDFGPALRALPKAGFRLPEAKHYVGELVVADIGFPRELLIDPSSRA